MWKCLITAMTVVGHHVLEYRPTDLAAWARIVQAMQLLPARTAFRRCSVQTASEFRMFFRETLPLVLLSTSRSSSRLDQKVVQKLAERVTDVFLDAIWNHAVINGKGRTITDLPTEPVDYVALLRGMRQ